MITVKRESIDGGRRFEWDILVAGTLGLKVNVYREFTRRGEEWRETKAVGGDYWPPPPCPDGVMFEAKRRLRKAAR